MSRYETGSLSLDKIDYIFPPVEKAYLYLASQCLNSLTKKMSYAVLKQIHVYLQPLYSSQRKWSKCTRSLTQTHKQKDGGQFSLSFIKTWGQGTAVSLYAALMPFKRNKVENIVTPHCSKDVYTSHDFSKNINMKKTSVPNGWVYKTVEAPINFNCIEANHLHASNRMTIKGLHTSD